MPASCQLSLGDSTHPQQGEAGSSAVVKGSVVKSAVKILMQIHIPGFLSQIRVSPGVNKFDSKYLHPHNLRFSCHVVSVKALKPYLVM